MISIRSHTHLRDHHGLTAATQGSCESGMKQSNGVSTMWIKISWERQLLGWPISESENIYQQHSRYAFHYFIRTNLSITMQMLNTGTLNHCGYFVQSFQNCSYVTWTFSCLKSPDTRQSAQQVIKTRETAIVCPEWSKFSTAKDKTIIEDT